MANLIDLVKITHLNRILSSVEATQNLLKDNRWAGKL